MVGVVASVTYLEMRSFEQHLTDDLADAGRLAAQSAANAVAPSIDRNDAADVRDSLHDLLDSDPALDAISVVDLDTSGQSVVVASTSTEERAEALDLARRAIAAGRHSPIDAAPSCCTRCRCRGGRRSAVVVTVGLESVLQTRSHGASHRAGVRSADGRSGDAPGAPGGPAAGRPTARGDPADDGAGGRREDGAPAPM